MVAFLFSLIISPAWADDVEVAPLHSIDAQVLFESAVKTPSEIVICGQSFVTFSVVDQSLVAFDLTTGVQQFSTKIKNDKKFDVSALACRENEILVLTNVGRMNFPEILAYSFAKNNSSLNFRRTYKFSYYGRATDLLCNGKSCQLLQDALWQSNNLEKWDSIFVPPIKDISLSQKRLEANPFDDWQASLILAKGHYSKAARNSLGEYALLDRNRSQVVIQHDGSWEKWGSFGVWEGRLLDANSISYVTDKILALADAKLKALFLFRNDGQYLGIVKSAENRIFSPQYPLGIAVKNKIFYVADFRKNIISALKIANLVPDESNLEVLSVRQNLFRRPEVIHDHESSVCIGCHDGVESNQLVKFMTSAHHHPLACNNCHDPHHESQFTHNLKSPEQKLCISCHEKYGQTKSNHIWTHGPTSKGGQCSDCHEAHSESKALLLNPMNQLCLRCHQNQSINHRELSDLALADIRGQKSFAGTALIDNKISCVTCHQTHKQSRAVHFLRSPENVLNLCSSCHGVRAEKLYHSFHTLMKNKRSASGGSGK